MQCDLSAIILPTLPVDVLLIGHIKLGYAKQGQRLDILDAIWMRLSTSRGPRRLLKRAIGPIGHCRANQAAEKTLLIHALFSICKFQPPHDYHPLGVMHAQYKTKNLNGLGVVLPNST